MEPETCQPHVGGPEHKNFKQFFSNLHQYDRHKTITFSLVEFVTNMTACRESLEIVRNCGRLRLGKSRNQISNKTFVCRNMQIYVLKFSF